MTATMLSRRAVRRPSGLIVPGPGTPTSPSGFDPTNADLPGWRHLGVERFDRPAALGQFPGTAYPAKWVYNGAEDTSRTLGRPAGYRGRYNSLKTCWVDEGSSRLRIRCYVDADGVPWVANICPQFPPGTTRYSHPIGRRYSTVVRATNILGRGAGAFKHADLWWSGRDQWPDGEFNFPEATAGQTDMEGFSHRTDGDPSKNAWQIRTAAASFAAWHRYDKLWIPAFGPHPPRLTYVLDFGTPNQQAWTIPVDRTSYGVPTVSGVRRAQFETWLSSALVPAGSEVTWEVDHVEEWEFDPATFDQTAYDLIG